MFDVGTKIVALTSSQKKGPGPRRGSVGYVISSLDGVYMDDTNLAASVTHVMFTRYGFERNKERREKRTFINLFPVLHSEKGDVVKSTKEAIKAIHRTKFDKDYWKRIISAYGLKHGTPFGVLVPVCDNEVDLRHCSENEFIAWLDSYLMSPLFRNVLIGMIKSPKKVKVMHKWVKKLTDIAHDKEKKFVVLPIIERENRPEAIHAIRLVEAIGVANALRRENKEFSNILDNICGKHRLVNNNIYRGFIDGLYSVYKYKPRQEILRSLKREQVDTCINNLEQTKLLLGASSSPLLRMGRKKEPKLRKEVNDFLSEF